MKWRTSGVTQRRYRAVGAPQRSKKKKRKKTDDLLFHHSVGSFDSCARISPTPWHDCSVEHTHRRVTLCVTNVLDSKNHAAH